MGIGLILNNGSAVADLALARRAEAAGVAAVYCFDFFASNAVARLGALAAGTSTVRIGSGIANTFTRSPMVLANAALDIDSLSNGRLMLGLGTGLQKMNEQWYDVEYGKPLSRARELLDLLRHVFAHSGFGLVWQGDSWNLNIPAYYRQEVQRSDIPLLLAAVNRRMIALAGEKADGMMGHPVHSWKWHSEVTLPILREAEHSQGRAEGSCVLYPHVITSVQANRDEALLDAKRQIGFSFSVEHYHTILDLHGMREVGNACRAHLASYDFEAMAGCIPDELVEEIAIACTPDEFADRLEKWRTLTPEPILFPASIGVPQERLASNQQAILDFASREQGG
jgi:alkanesulfonate monooxygenase SsuD/methylene tetrahydromethanopterin reductase-like flavin-dependent oxidoreductase (luciferase family)